MAELIARAQQEHDAPKRTELTDKERAVIQSMTWGTAGAAVIIVVAIATSSKTFSGPAILIAESCFAFTVPLLIAFGFAFSHQWSSAKEPPPSEERINLGALILAAQLVFAAGLASLLWSFDFHASIVFLVAAYLAWRANKNLVVHRISPAAREKVSNMLKDAMAQAEASKLAQKPDPQL